ncbi:MAG: hypothetical protein GXP41_08870 [Chloroflexi bacterium]|nr:hypothetical protein [Chloroflexota bacterium]
MTNSETKNTQQTGETPRTGWTWGLGGSLFASLCCLGPAVAALVGIGSASFLLGLSRYRIPLLLVGLGFAGLGLAKALRQSQQTCSLAQHRRNLWLFPAMTLLTFAATYGILTYVVPTAVYNSLSPSVTAASPVQTKGGAEQPSVPSQPEAQPPAAGQPPATPTQPPAVTPHRVTLAISGMT